MKYEIITRADGAVCEVTENEIRYMALTDAENVFYTVEFLFSDWEDDAYLMIPACAYNGNRQKRVVRSYPPMYHPEETGIDCEPLMTDVPALNPDGSGSIQVTTGDMATPCIGIFYREKKECFFLYTEQQVKDTNIGYTVEAGKITLSMPANRTDLYRFCRPHLHEGDRGITVIQGEKIVSRYLLLTFPCTDITEFYQHYFETRKLLLHDARAEANYDDELWALMEMHYNSANWNKPYYAELSHDWQPGWCGCCMSSYILLKYGNALSKKRAVSTIECLLERQAASGLYYGVYTPDGKRADDNFGVPGMEDILLIRRMGDVVYYMMKHLTIEGRTPDPRWEASVSRGADALVKIYKEYGTFGQFVNVETGKMVVGTGACGSIVPGAFAKVSDYFGDPSYLAVAEESLRMYCENYLEKGIMNGGPGDILSACDSESVFALLESCTVLYEMTKKPEYLKWAEEAAHLASSWVVTYSYHFPETSEFGKRGVNTVGTVFANVQNKHSAPGICTFSGDSLYKLWKWTGNRAYLELIRDIAYAIPQCVSTDERPISSWDDPPLPLLPGYICERVNMSDWEGFECVGGVFCGSSWCETSLVLTMYELMCYPEMRDCTL